MAKGNTILSLSAASSLALLSLVIVGRLHFAVLPVAFILLGALTSLWRPKRALILFLFLLPLVPATPDLFFNGYPFNYMAVPLFYLAGILMAAAWRGERLAPAFPGSGFYLVFLTLLGVSAVFVLLRWSNLGLSRLAFLRDTPVAPSGDRLSFSCIFPAIAWALFALSPYLAALIRRRGLRRPEVALPLQLGFSLSFLLALVQKFLFPGFLSQAWWGLQKSQVNGGFSDFNAFGFFAGALFFHQVLRLMERMPRRQGTAPPGPEDAGHGRSRLRIRPAAALDALFLLVALSAVFLSGCRTALLFILAAGVAFLFRRGIGAGTRTALALLLAGSLLFVGGTLGRRLKQSLGQVARLASSGDVRRELDRLSNGRLELLGASARMVGRFPLSGVGAGNFLFYLKYLEHGKQAYYDLPLNQYLLFFSETGLLGGAAFLFFIAALWRRLRRGTERAVIAAMAAVLFLNNFFWFPEALLLFWCFVALAAPAGDDGAERHPPGRRASVPGVLALATVALFVAANVAGFRALHPACWAGEKKVPYEYGFSYPESVSGSQFRWTGAAAGMYVRLDRDAAVRLHCGAPLAALPGRKQEVDVYWRGRHVERVVFRRNGERRLRLAGKASGEGFLEFRVRPAFNLAKLGLGRETRTLGIQVGDRAL